MVKFILEISLKERIRGLADLFLTKPDIDLHLREADYEFMAWGDPICCDDFRQRLGKNKSPEFIVKNLYGHYYYLFLNRESGNLIIGNSLFSILPIYYHCTNEKITVSENAPALGISYDPDNISRRFILETMLFNYPLFNNSVYRNIVLLQANSSITVSGGKCSVKKHTIIADLFEQEPVQWRKSLEKVSEKFLETVKKYLSPEHYTSSLTGGFDGRTLVAAGLFYGRKFSTYSFGTETSKDITVAEALSASASLYFNKIVLGEDYIKQESLKCGKEFILNSSGVGTFARAHYLHAVKKLSADNKYIVTGNFGSEIFRAAHVTGQVISKNLFNIFNSNSPESALRLIETSEEFQCLASESFKKEWISLKEEIHGLPIFSRDYSGLTRNRRFYVFVFEELFRKYFGAEIINQFIYLKNRTPYLDIDFLVTVLGTELAGINSDFFEDNPLKRYRGQVFYAHVIKKAYPALGKAMTDKGYRPDDLMNFFGKANIVKSLLKKNVCKVPSDEDPNGVTKAWEANREYWRNMLLYGEYFSQDKINRGIDKEILYKILSLSFVMNSLPKR
jgi:asparagine synthase (glutamine-hydrolysing)